MNPERETTLAVMPILGEAAANAGIGGIVRVVAEQRAAALLIRLRDPARALVVTRAARSAFPGRLIVSARADVAALAGADGVHLPEGGPQVGDVRRAFPGLVVGVSRHDRDGLLRAQRDGADYALLGPVFETPGKEGRSLGLDRFAAIVDGLSLPVWAVGGIDASNAASCLGAGAAGVAGIRAFESVAAAEASLRGLGRHLVKRGVGA